MTMRNYLLLTAAIAVSAIVTAQQPVPVGVAAWSLRRCRCHNGGTSRDENNKYCNTTVR